MVQAEFGHESADMGVDLGLVTRERRGKWSYYAVVPQSLDALGNVLRVQHDGHDPATCC